MHYYTNLCYAAYLEDFTTKSTLQAKNNYEQFSTSYRNSTHLYRANNGQFSDHLFIKDVYNNLQILELYSISAYHQNNISKWAIYIIIESARVMLLHARHL